MTTKRQAETEQTLIRTAQKQLRRLERQFKRDFGYSATYVAGLIQHGLNSQIITEREGLDILQFKRESKIR